MPLDLDFGVLDPRIDELRFGGLRVTAKIPKIDYDEWVAAEVHKDGWYYEPLTTEHRQEPPPRTQPEARWASVSNTTRPAHLFHNFATHTLHLPDADTRHPSATGTRLRVDRSASKRLAGC